MANQQLLDYIKQQIDEGVSKEDMKSTLLQNGWSDVDIDKAVKQMESVSLDVSGAQRKDAPVFNDDNETEINKGNILYKLQPKSTKIIVIIFVLVILIAIIGMTLYSTFSGFTETSQSGNNQINSLIIDDGKALQLSTQDLTEELAINEKTDLIGIVKKEESAQNSLLPPVDIKIIEALNKKAFNSYAGVNITDLHQDNHYRLLNCELELRASSLSGEEYSVEQIKTCYMSLYKDALFARVVYGDLSDSTAQQLINEIDDSLAFVKLELLVPVGNYLREDYLNLLSPTLDRLFEIKGRVDINSTVPVRFDENLYGKRKRLSDGYYNTLMKYYFKDGDASMVDKVTYFEGVIAENDFGLMEFGVGFFEDVKGNTKLSSAEVEVVNGVIQLYEKWVSDNTRKIQY